MLVGNKTVRNVSAPWGAELELIFRFGSVTGEKHLCDTIAFIE